MLQTHELRDAVLQLAHEIGGDLHPGRLGEVVDEERQVRGRCDRLIVVDDPPVAWSDEERRHRADRIDPSSRRLFRVARGPQRGLSAHVHDDVRSSLILIHCRPGDPMIFLVGKQNALASASCRPKAMHSSADVVLHDCAEGALVHLASVVRHRRNDRGDYSMKFHHVVLLDSSSNLASYCTICAAMCRLSPDTFSSIRSEKQLRRAPAPTGS